ncbi:DUF3592 domain-containing protein [Spirillospora sp. NPDC029432]|uniref:DUF3592 domain-containing protein n=1 Tax=Spirillospora sp. NPDC029432 TaxID=3154599 RepID=UPI00345212D4
MAGTVGGLFFAVFGLGMLAAGPVLLLRRLRVREGAARAEGTVLASDWDRPAGSGGAGSTYRLTVRYAIPDGREFTFSEGGRPDADVGGRVTVFYDPAAPEKGRVGYSVRQIWWRALALSGGGLFFTWLGTQFIGS